VSYVPVCDARHSFRELFCEWQVSRAWVLAPGYSDLLERARPELEQVIKTHPDFAEAHADHGIILAKLPDYRQAPSEIRQVIELGYSDPIAYNYLGVLLIPGPLPWGEGWLPPLSLA
jgi:hypothetical protein